MADRNIAEQRDRVFAIRREIGHPCRRETRRARREIDNALTSIEGALEVLGDADRSSPSDDTQEDGTLRALNAQLLAVRKALIDNALTSIEDALEVLGDADRSSPSDDTLDDGTLRALNAQLLAVGKALEVARAATEAAASIAHQAVHYPVP